MGRTMSGPFKIQKEADVIKTAYPLPLLFAQRGSTALGLSKPFANTVTSKATLDFTAQARVCPGKAGFCSGTFALLVSSGAHDEVEAGGAADEAEGLTASRGFCAQATPTTIIKTVRTDAI